MIEYFWQAKLITGGVYVGVRTFFAGPLVDGEYLDRSPRWQAQVRLETSGRAILTGDHCPIEVEGKNMMLRNVEPITEEQYRYLISHAGWATQFAPHSPDASPTTKIDWMKSKIPF